MFGSTLDGGGNCTQVARWRCPSGEVDRSIVVAVVHGGAAVAGPDLGLSWLCLHRWQVFDEAKNRSASISDL
jgi:hypothetical protein